MSCRYIYKGNAYTKDELVQVISQEAGPEGLRIPEIFRSIKTAKKKQQSKIVSDTTTVLYQRYADAKHMLQAIQNSTDSKDVKLKKTAYYKGIMERTRKSIKSLLETPSEKQLEFILDQAEIDAKMVEALYSSNAVTFTELQFANSVVDTWFNLKQALGIESTSEIEDEPTRRRVREVINNFSELNDQTRRIAIELIKNSQHGTKVTEEEITKLQDTSFATEWVRELTTTGIPVANKLAAIIKETNLRINREHNQNYAKIDGMFQKIQNNPLFKKHGFDLFVKTQKNRQGMDTLGIVTRYSQTFWDAFRDNNRLLKKSLEAAGDDKEKIKKAWQVFNAWNEANTIPFNALLFLEQAAHTDQQRQAEIDRMKLLGFNESEINEIIVESQRKYDRFLENKEFYQARMELEAMTSPELVPQDMTADEYVQMKVEEYDNLNNPLKYLEQKFSGKKKIDAYGGAKYTYLIPAKSIKDRPTGYYDENFSKIASDPALFEFYTWFTGFMKENLSWLPQEEIEDLHSNFLPVIADRLAREYGFTNLKESVKGLGDWFMKALTDVEYQDKVSVNPFSKKERREFKARFVEEAVPVEDRSKDLVLIAKMFSDMALIYKHKNTIKAEVDTINDVIQNTKGSYKLNRKLNVLERQEKDATRVQSLADFTVRRGFYGIRSEEKWLSDESFYDWKELVSLGLWQSEKAKRAKMLSENIQRIQKALENDGITDKQREILEKEMEKLKTEYRSLGGRKFSFAATIDSAITNTRLVSLGFSPFSAVRNLLVGKINNRIHAQGGRDFNQKELLWANKVLTEAAGKYWSKGSYETRNTRLLFGLMSDTGIAEGEDGMYLRSMVDKHTSIDKFREMLPKAYTWLSSGDYHFKAEMMLAAMKHQKVKTAKGEVSFWEVLTEDRQYNEKDFGAWNTEANGGLSFEDFYIKQMLKYKQLAAKLHGASGKEVYIKAKDNAIGRLLMVFKSWLPETVGVRFDPKHKDALLDRWEEGYYRTFFKVLKEKKLGIIKMILNASLNRDVAIQDEMVLSNFKKAVKELQIIVTLWMAYILLKSMAPDDDEDKKIYNMLVMRQLHDLNRDLTYYFNINSIGELQRDVFPIIRTAENWGSALKAAGYYTLGVEDKDGDVMYDGERTALKITKVLPVLSNVNRAIYYQKQL